MKMPEPIGCGYVVKLDGASQTGFAHILGVDVYDKQALIDLLEAAAREASYYENHSITAKNIAAAIRSMKEKL